jgi:hypothetical protein
MLDVIAAIAFGLLFGLAAIYIHGCDRLKGTRL